MSITRFGEIFGYMDKSLNWSINKIIVLSVIYSNNFTQITNRQKLLLSFPHSFSSLLPVFILFCSTSTTLLLGKVSPTCQSMIGIRDTVHTWLALSLCSKCLQSRGEYMQEKIINRGWKLLENYGYNAEIAQAKHPELEVINTFLQIDDVELSWWRN